MVLPSSDLFAAKQVSDILIVEDDYELEANYVGQPLPALKSLDREGRVIYVGSFSKTLFPGLRLGFVVASQSLIREMRALRRLMVRHPPTNNQRSTAFFLSFGYYDVFMRRLHRVYHERWTEMGNALEHHLPDAEVSGCVVETFSSSRRAVRTHHLLGGSRPFQPVV